MSCAFGYGIKVFRQVQVSKIIYPVSYCARLNRSVKPPLVVALASCDEM